MLCSTVLSARNDNYVSDLRFFGEPLCCSESVVFCFSDAGPIALCPNLLEANTLKMCIIYYCMASDACISPLYMWSFK